MFRQMLVSVIFMLGAFVGHAQNMTNGTIAPTPGMMMNGTEAPTPGMMMNGTIAPTPGMMMNGTIAPTPGMMMNGTEAPTPGMMMNGTIAPTPGMMMNGTTAPTPGMMMNGTTAPTPGMMMNGTGAPTPGMMMSGAPTAAPAMNGTGAPTASMSNSTMISYVVLSTTITIDADNNCTLIGAFADALKSSLASELSVPASMITVQVNGLCNQTTMGRRLLATTTIVVSVAVKAADKASSTTKVTSYLTPGTVGDIASKASLTLNSPATVGAVSQDECQTGFYNFQQTCGCPANMTTVAQCPDLCANYLKSSSGCAAALPNPKSTTCSGTLATLATNVNAAALACKAPVNGAAQVSFSIVAFILAAAFW